MLNTNDKLMPGKLEYEYGLTVRIFRNIKDCLVAGRSDGTKENGKYN
jgi:hypothetical protein